MQYTIRNIPDDLDHALRERAHAERKSMNQVALELLAAAVGLERQAAPRRRLHDLAGTWGEDPEFDAALLSFERLDDDLWR